MGGSKLKKKAVIYAGKKVRDSRLKAGIGTQKELGERTGINPNIISDLERGRRNISPAWAMKIAEVVGKEYKELLKDV